MRFAWRGATRCYCRLARVPGYQAHPQDGHAQYKTASLEENRKRSIDRYSMPTFGWAWHSGVLLDHIKDAGGIMEVVGEQLGHRF